MSTRDPEEESPPSFFKVILNPSAPHLSLPNAFVRSYLENIPRNPTLVTEKREHSWRLEFVKIGEDYCFASGWEKLVKDVQLCSRDIVIFWLIDPLTFRVTFLGTNGCQKDLPSNDAVKDDGHDGDVEVMPDENLCFRKVFSKTAFKYYMPLPINFVKAAGLENKQSIMLKDHEGKEWNMGMMIERYARTRYSLAEGWVMFRKHHKLSDADVCVFAFSKNEGVLKVKVEYGSGVEGGNEPVVAESVFRSKRVVYF